MFKRYNLVRDTLRRLQAITRQYFFFLFRAREQESIGETTNTTQQSIRSNVDKQASRLNLPRENVET